MGADTRPRLQDSELEGERERLVEPSSSHDVEDVRARPSCSESDEGRVEEVDVEEGLMERTVASGSSKGGSSSGGTERPHGTIQLTVKTTADERSANVFVKPEDTVLDLRRALSAHAEKLLCDVMKSRLLFQGRFLSDDEAVSAVGLGEGHTVLMVPKPAEPGGAGGGASAGAGQAAGAGAGAGAAGGVSSAEAAISTAGREQLEFLLGLLIGFLLGWLAILCFCETRTSKRFFQGLVFGMGLSIVMAFTQYRPTDGEGGIPDGGPVPH